MFPLYVDGKLDKGNAMQQAVGGYERLNLSTLQDVFFEVTKADCIYAPIHWRQNHRKASNAILQDIDMMVYDSDDGDTVEEITTMLSGVEFLLIETASWSPQKAKYRLFIPLDNPITFTDENEYKACYRWLGDLIGLRYDTSTTECGRGYIGIADKGGYLNTGIKLNIAIAWSQELKRITKVKNRMNLRNHIRRSKFSSSSTSQLLPQHLVNKDKFKEYSSKIYEGNYNNGIMGIIGYFKNSGCLKGDVEAWLIDQRYGSADKAYIQHRMRNWGR